MAGQAYLGQNGGRVVSGTGRADLRSASTLLESNENLVGILKRGVHAIGLEHRTVKLINAAKIEYVIDLVGIPETELRAILKMQNKNTNEAALDRAMGDIGIALAQHNLNLGMEIDDNTRTLALN